MFFEGHKNVATVEQENLGRLKVAFVGGAFDSAVGRAHRTAVEMDQRFQLVAGYFSRNQEKSQKSASFYSIDHSKAYSCLNDFLEREAGNLDAIVIMTPQNQHGAQVLACIDADIPVICEKALVDSLSGAEAIRDRLIEKQGFLAVTYNYTGYPMIRELQFMVQTGVLGKIQHLHMEMPQEGFARLSPDKTPIVPQDWRLLDGEIPTISLDLGVHLHMMARFLTDEQPEKVVALSSSRGNFKKIIDNVQCLARYSNGIDCSIWYSKTAFGYRNGLRIRIIGDRGSAEWVQEDPEHLQFGDNLGGRFILDRTNMNTQIANQDRYQRFKAGHPAGFIEAFANYYVDVADALQRYQLTKKCHLDRYTFGIDESLEGLQMLAAITRSCATNRWEKVE